MGAEPDIHGVVDDGGTCESGVGAHGGHRGSAGLQLHTVRRGRGAQHRGTQAPCTLD